MTKQITKKSTLATIDIPSWFKVVAIIALVWNLLGVLAFAGQMMLTPEMLAELPVAEQELYASTPLWATIAFAIAVFFGAFGSLLLLLKKALSTAILILSLVGVVVQMLHTFLLSKSLEVLGPNSMIMPVIVILIAIYLVWLSKNAQVNGWFS
ncbi:MAG: hypothetical protein HRT53_13820 [Colwellia sp.]|nr:hypothetical protein [Colwellia sp.]